MSGLLMRRRFTFALLSASLLAGGWGCNAQPPVPLTAAVPPAATRPGLATTAPAPSRFQVDMKQAVEFLASDALEGRMIGTPGIRKVADYIAGDFAKIGLPPVPGLSGYFQPFTTVTRVDPDQSKTVLAINGKPLKLGEDYLPVRASGDGPAQGPLAFAGYGIVDPEKHYDDYAGLDARGKIVLILRYEPQTAQGKSRLSGNPDEWSPHATIMQKVRTAQDHGAVGVLLVNPALYHDDEGLLPFHQRYPFGAKVPVMHVSVAAADRILADAGAPSLKALQTDLDQLKPRSFVLSGVSGHMAFAIKETSKSVENVAALLPGIGPHADEYVVVGAHYDHLGHGGPGSLAPWSHGIHHGADDNASGTAAVLKLAERLKRLGPQPRSIIFICFTAEEEGLIGSSYFVNHCPVPLDKIVAMLNLDMVGRVRSQKLLIGGEKTAQAFAELVEHADQGLPLELSEFGSGGGMGPSDHMSFALKKIPVLFFFSGLHMDYHRPSDTADKINYAGMEEVVKLGVRLLQEMARMPRQTYNASADARGMLQMAGPTSRPVGGRASLGAIPDYSQGEDAKGGMRIGGIVPGSPADKLGLRAGDVVVQFNGTKIDNMMDYTAALGAARPGQTVAIKLLRSSKPLDVQATLAARKD